MSSGDSNGWGWSMMCTAFHPLYKQSGPNVSRIVEMIHHAGFSDRRVIFQLAGDMDGLNTC
jgi:hypothetical protein